MLPCDFTKVTVDEYTSYVFAHAQKSLEVYTRTLPRRQTERGGWEWVEKL